MSEWQSLLASGVFSSKMRWFKQMDFYLLVLWIEYFTWKHVLWSHYYNHIDGITVMYFWFEKKQNESMNASFWNEKLHIFMLMLFEMDLLPASVGCTVPLCIDSCVLQETCGPLRSIPPCCCWHTLFLQNTGCLLKEPLWAKRVVSPCPVLCSCAAAARPFARLLYGWCHRVAKVNKQMHRSCRCWILTVSQMFTCTDTNTHFLSWTLTHFTQPDFSH